MANPVISIYPQDDETEVFTRSTLRVRCVDPDVTVGLGINQATLAVTLSVGSTAMGAITGGAFVPGFAGTITGDPLDETDGVTAVVLPLGGKWLPNVDYTVSVTVANVNGDSTTETVTYQTDSHTCFEDELPAPNSIETVMIAGGFPTKLEQLRVELMKAISGSGVAQVRTRSILWYAYLTDLSTLLANWVDYGLDDVKLCDRRGPSAVYIRLQKFIPRVREFTAELTGLSEVSKNLLEKRVNHENIVYVVSAFANIVTLGAVGKVQGWEGF